MKGDLIKRTLDHRKFNFTNYAETKWLSRDKIRPPRVQISNGRFYLSSGFDTISQKGTLQRGITQIFITQRDITKRAITQRGISQRGMAKRHHAKNLESRPYYTQFL